MSARKKRTTICLQADLRRALRRKSAETNLSISRFVNEALRDAFAQDAEDLDVFDRRQREPMLSFGKFVKRLKRSGKI